MAIRQREKRGPNDLLITSYKPSNIYRIVSACTHDLIKDGSLVVINQHGITPFEWEGKNHVFIREEHILAILTDSDLYEDVNE